MATKDRNAWINVQRKTFTNWFNAQLKRGGYSSKVESLKDDLEDGIKLHNLLESISGKKLPKITLKPKMKLQKIENLNVCLHFIASCGVKLIGISSEEIHDHNEKLILGMVWTLILRFEIQDISVEDLTAREGLLLWCQKKTKGYRGVDVQNFTRSWHDGLAFCALIHKHRPDLINYDSLTKEDPLGNLELAFKVAEEKLDIQRFFDPEDVAVADDKSMMTYLMQYFKAFSDSQKAEIAGRRIGKLVGLLKSNEELRNDYEKRAREWCEWADKKLEELSDDKFDNTLEGAQKKLDLVQEYQKEEKPMRAGQKYATESVFKNLQVSLRNNGRAPYVPPEGISPKDMNDKWAKLLEAEKCLEKKSREEVARQQKLNNMAKRFYEKLAKIKKFEEAKREYLGQRPNVDTLSAAKSQVKLLDGYDKLYEDSKTRVEDLHKLGQELIDGDYRDKDKIAAELQWTDDAWKGLEAAAAEKRKWAEEELAKQEEMERLRLLFAEKAKSLSRWYKDTIETINSDQAFGENLQEVTDYKPKLDEKDEALRKESAEKKGELEEIAKKMEELGVKDNKYTVLTMDDINAGEQGMEEALKNRQEAYEAELARQKAMEEKRLEFAAAAQEYVDWLAAQKAEIDALQNEDAEALVGQIEGIVQEHKPGQEKLDKIRALDTECIQMGITSNPHTKWTVDGLEGEFMDHQAYTDKYIEGLHEEQERKNKYAERARRLMDWVHETEPKLQEREPATNLSGARAKRSEYDAYRTGQKPPKSAEKSAVIALAAALSDFMEKSPYHRPPFVPPEGLAPEDLEKAWSDLNAKEQEWLQFVKDEVKRHERLAALEKRLHQDAGDMEKWAEKKTQYLEKDEGASIHSVDDAQVSLHRMSVFHDDFGKKKPRLEKLKGDAETLTTEKQDGAEKATERVGKIQETFTGMEGLEETHKKALEEALESEKKKEALRVSFAQKAKAYVNWATKKGEKLENSKFPKGLEEVRAYKETADKTEAEVREESQKKHDECKAIADEMASLNVEGNNHTNLTMDDVDRASEKLEKSVGVYHENYEKALNRLEEMEKKRLEFAAAADAMAKLLEESRAAIDALEGEDPAALKEQVTSTFAEAEKEKAQMAEVRRLHGEELQMEITENPHTEHTVDSLDQALRDYEVYVHAYIEELEEEESMRSKYNKRAGDLVAWIEQQEQELSSGARMPQENTLASAQGAMDEFTDYRDGTKPGKTVEGDKVKALHAEATEILGKSEHKRPAFKASEDKLEPAAIDAAFAKLEEAENKHFEELSKVLAKQEDLSRRAREFDESAQDIEKWCKQSEEDLNREQDAQTVEAAQIAEDVLAAFDKEYSETMAQNIDGLKKASEGLVADDYCEKDAVSARCAEVVALYEGLKAARDGRAEKVSSQKDREMQKEDLRKQWAKMAKDYDKWVGTSVAKVNKYSLGGGLEKVKEANEQLAVQMAELRKESDEKKGELDALAGKMTEAGVTENVHSSTTPEDVEKFHQNLEDAIAKREKVYADELAHQEALEAKCVEFAEKANAFLELIQKNREELEAIDSEADPAAAMEKAKEVYDEKKPLDAALAELQTLDNEARSMKMTENPHTPHTMGSLNRKLVAHQKFYENLIKAMEEEKMMQERKGEREAEASKKEKVEGLKSEYSENQARLATWTDAVSEAIEGEPEASSIEDVDELQSDYDSVAAEATVAENKEVFDKLCELKGTLEENGVAASEVGHDDVVASWEKANNLIAARKEWLANERTRQEKIAGICKDYAEKAEAFHGWMEEQKNAEAPEGEIEAQCEAVAKQLEACTAEGTKKKEELEGLDKQLEEEKVSENPETTYTTQALAAEFDGLLDTIKAQQALLEQQKNSAKYSLPPEQVKEFVDLFNQFDKDKCGALNWFQFKAVLQALGEDVSDESVKKVIAETDTDGNGTISCDEFIEYMTKRLNDTSDSKEDIMAAFNDISNGRDFVTINELSAAVTPEQLEYIKANAPRVEGNEEAIDFKKWMETAFA